jgi:hypothetical protein
MISFDVKMQQICFIDFCFHYSIHIFRIFQCQYWNKSYAPLAKGFICELNN